MGRTKIICVNLHPSTSVKSVNHSFSKLINCNGHLLDLSIPQVMGILNVTPDSFYPGSRNRHIDDVLRRADQMLAEGASILDVGAYSSRPGAAHVSEEEEISRLRPVLEALFTRHPEAIVSVDTFRARVAEIGVREYGVALVNDIAAGEMDERMFETVARLQVPYIMMHMQGTPQNMQQKPHYKDLIREVFLYMEEKRQRLHALGVKDVILDPGFGFGKTLEHNYELLAALQEFSLFRAPLLVGVSRKSMITGLLDISSEEALNGTTVINTISLLKGADILRVHDVKQAVEAVKIYQYMQACNPDPPRAVTPNADTDFFSS